MLPLPKIVDGIYGGENGGRERKSSPHLGESNLGLLRRGPFTGNNSLDGAQVSA